MIKLITALVLSVLASFVISDSYSEITLSVEDSKFYNLEDIGPDAWTKISKNKYLTTTQNGGIYKVTYKDNRWRAKEWVNTGGRPMDVALDSAGNLIVADLYKGVLKITPRKKISVLLSDIDGSKIAFPNSIAIDSKDNIYISDSTKYTLANLNSEWTTYARTGRIIKIDGETQDAKIIAEDLSFANGIEFINDEKSLLVVETKVRKVSKLDLETLEISEFSYGFSGYPDNIYLSDKEDGYWVAFAHLSVEKIVATKIDLNGEIIRNIKVDPNLSNMTASGVVEINGKLLWLTKFASGVWESEL